MRQLRRMPNVMVVPLTYVWIYFTFNVIKWTRYTSGVISDLARVLQRKLWTIYARCGPYFSGDFGPYSHLSWILRTSSWFFGPFLTAFSTEKQKKRSSPRWTFFWTFGPLLQLELDHFGRVDLILVIIVDLIHPFSVRVNVDLFA